MVSDRLSELEQNLKSLYEQRYALEQGALMTPDDEKRIQNEQKIRDKIRPQIQKYEEEYLQQLKQRAVRLTFGEEDAQAVIDVVAQDKGEYDQAIADYNQALKLNPSYAEAYYNRGNAYAAKGEYDQAITDYNQALKLNPNFAEAYVYRGIAYRAKGDKQKAIADFQACLKLTQTSQLKQIAQQQLAELGVK